MIKWFKKNYILIIRLCYIIPILVAAGISIYHVIKFYNLTNSISWAIYLSIGVEIAALSALAGMTVKINKFVYFPFLVVTFIQIIGNVFASYLYIDITSKEFKSWMELISPVFNMMGLENYNDVMFHKRFLGIISGIFIPVISLSFLHLLVSFNESIAEEKNKKNYDTDINKNDIQSDNKNNLLKDNNEQTDSNLIVEASPINNETSEKTINDKNLTVEAPPINNETSENTIKNLNNIPPIPTSKTKKQLTKQDIDQIIKNQKVKINGIKN